MSCNFCEQTIDYVAEAITCGNCKRTFHPNPCSTLTQTSWKAMSSQNRRDWRCNICRKVRCRADEDEASDSSISKRYRADNGSMRSLKGELTSRMDEMSSKFEGMFGEIKEHLKETSISQGALTKKIEELMAECKLKDKKIDSLEARVNNLEQKLLENNVVIVNAPSLKPPVETLLDIAKAAEVSIVGAEIVDAYRTKDNKLIVKFVNKKTKILLMKKVRERKVTCDCISNRSIGSSSSNNSSSSTNSNNNKKIFVNDELTRSNRHLLWLAKGKAKEANWRFVWVKDGRILAKKTEGDRPTYICSNADINFTN